VTGVQTCALPIYGDRRRSLHLLTFTSLPSPKISTLISGDAWTTNDSSSLAAIDACVKPVSVVEGLAKIHSASSGAARFVCAAAIRWDGGERVFTDEACGTIADMPRGSNGFGYDPIFYYEPAGKTFAELTLSEKAEVSHRGRAFRQLASWLKRSVTLDTSESSDRIIFPTVESSASSVRGDV